jgi:membrane protein DedA with SNARE-associated domain
MLMEGIPQYVAPQLLAFNAFLLGFGFWQTIIILYAGSIVGSVIGFEVGHSSNKIPYTLLYTNKKYEKIKENFSKYGHWFIFVTSISPLPYLPYIFGVMRVKRKDFIFYGVVNNLFLVCFFDC